MQMLLYCVYIKRRSEAASLALGLLLKLQHASVFFSGRNHYLQYLLAGLVSHSSRFSCWWTCGISMKNIDFLRFECNAHSSNKSMSNGETLHIFISLSFFLSFFSFSQQLKLQSQIALRWDSAHGSNNNFNYQNIQVCLSLFYPWGH